MTDPLTVAQGMSLVVLPCALSIVAGTGRRSFAALIPVAPAVYLWAATAIQAREETTPRGIGSDGLWAALATLAIILHIARVAVAQFFPRALCKRGESPIEDPSASSKESPCDAGVDSDDTPPTPSLYSWAKWLA